MGFKYVMVALVFLTLLIINLVWVGTNLYFFIIDGTETILQGTNFVENIYYSLYLKWILLFDFLWIIGSLIFMLKRKDFKTNFKLHYLEHKKINNPKICVVIPVYNEEESIHKVISDFSSQPFVKHIIVIDNHSSDSTVTIAESLDATVIRKNENKGFAHSYILGLKEALKTDSNIIVTTEAGDTYNAYDISKMLPFLENCDMVIGTRQNQVLTEKGNQNSVLHVWGNLFLAKLIQMKYFNLLHMGFVNLTDVGCIYRSFTRESIEKIINELTIPNTDKPVAGIAISLHITILGIKHDLRIIEVPITFKKRMGESKLQSNKKFKAIHYGLLYLWFILKI